MHGLLLRAMMLRIRLLLLVATGNISKAKSKLGWTPKIKFKELVAEMVREGLKTAGRDELVKKHGYSVLNCHE